MTPTSRFCALALSLTLGACRGDGGQPMRLLTAPPASAQAPAESPLRNHLLPSAGAALELGPTTVGATAQPVAAPPTPAPDPAADDVPSGQPQGERVHVSHVLIMHAGSAMRPPEVTRTAEQAQTLAGQLLVRARAGEDFAALARQYSDEPGHERKAGELGAIGRGMTVAPFERAAFALSVGQVSEVVQTEFGYHIIKRTQ
ncbi:MAG: peptidyl-prolyl cis-trans isomerase [Deltaproteobacteria bacterium]|nr:peptidyl-prolyl cis-trans isomerase [Deltaproteobacteria bacterium]